MSSMIPDEPRLLPDGRVFPPVTPDPPTPPGQEQIVAPDLVIQTKPEPRGDSPTEGDTGSEAPPPQRTA